ncbi:hypothetical protein [Nocardioides soli]|uniref:Exo-alpha-sialidase n=1 Tax=Nocardioides soli TaxID=1036020 RepID=A0A7W4YZ79_9ACTN|nr:hypothetical protein [Nocardioides soli]MBB3040864.1 hypothetical protein [Nocardioides soli]
MNTHTPDAHPTSTPDPSATSVADGRPPGRRPSHRGALAIGAAATLLMVTLLVVALTDPGGGDHPGDGATGPNAGVGTPMIGHIHGIVPDPEGDQTDHRVLIGAHYGLFSVDADGNVAQVGDDVTDYMALTAAGPGRLLASGHPEPTDESRPMNLGLIESRDGGRQWNTLSLDGAADFHALEHAPGEPGRTWGIDSVTGGLVTSTDERAWQTVHEQPLVDIALDPGDPARVLATTGDGRLLEVTADRSGTVDEGAFEQAPRLGLIDWPAADVLVGVGANGRVSRSNDGGRTWVELARVPGDPSALGVVGHSWFAATSDGLFRGPVDPDAADEDVKQVLAYGE